MRHWGGILFSLRGIIFIFIELIEAVSYLLIGISIYLSACFTSKKTYNRIFNKKIWNCPSSSRDQFQFLCFNGNCPHYRCHMIFQSDFNQNLTISYVPFLQQLFQLNVGFLYSPIVIYNGVCQFCFFLYWHLRGNPLFCFFFCIVIAFHQSV